MAPLRFLYYVSCCRTSHGCEIGSVCNTYRITPKHGVVKGVVGRVADAIARLPSSLVRKSDPGVVMRDGMGLKIRLS